MKKLLLSLFVVSAFVSCNIQHQSTKITRLKSKNQPIAVVDTTLSASDIIERTLQNQPSFITLNIPKFDLNVQFGQVSYTLRGSLRIIKDSIISLSVQPMLGIEVARIDFNPEFFTIYDKMNHRYSETPYDVMYIGTGIPFNFNAIQSMLSAHFFSIPHRDSHSFILENNTDSTYVLVGNDNLSNMFQYFEINFGSFLLSVSGLQRGKSMSLPFSVIYSDWRLVNRKYKFPYHITIELDHNKFLFLANAIIEEIDFDKDINITNINLERYKRVPFSTFFTEQKI